MMLHTITLQLPENIYLRLREAAHATKQSLNNIILRAVAMGSPPDRDDIPAEHQADLAELDRLDDSALWRIARSVHQETDFVQYDDMLDKNKSGMISDQEHRRLAELRTWADRFMIRKAHAAALLRWRGHKMPPMQ
jgi:hypothetical protein